jgi:hypothetical protein
MHAMAKPNWQKLLRSGPPVFERGYEARLSKDLRQFLENWPTLPHRDQELILILARVRKIPHGNVKSKASKTAQQKHGETREWLLTAIAKFKDSNGYMTDREIARHVGVSPTTLSRNAAYKHAKRTFLKQDGNREFKLPKFKTFETVLKKERGRDSDE